jgi:hypothetical protein
MFESVPNYSRYRTLRLTTPNMRGEDVFALQTALNDRGLGFPLGVIDGILGPKTARAITQAQEEMSITADGLAGGQTQSTLVRRLADRARYENSLPIGLVFGQLMHESSCRVGNYSAAREDGSYDAGVAQRNTRFHSPSEAFHVPGSIELLGVHLRRYYDKYQGLPTRRRWELAAGAWNAPAYANYIAREEGAKTVSVNETARPSSSARAKLEEYMDDVTVFMQL